jgi:hypothetical protein
MTTTHDDATTWRELAGAALTHQAFLATTAVCDCGHTHTDHGRSSVCVGTVQHAGRAMVCYCTRFAVAK